MLNSTKIVPFQYERSTFTVFFFENKCVIFTMDKANGKTKKPSRRVHFLLQKNTGKQSAIKEISYTNAISMED